MGRPSPSSPSSALPTTTLDLPPPPANRTDLKLFTQAQATEVHDKVLADTRAALDHLEKQLCLSVSPQTTSAPVTTSGSPGFNLEDGDRRELDLHNSDRLSAKFIHHAWSHVSVCMPAWLHSWLTGWIDARMCANVCMYVCMHACLHACMHACIYVMYDYVCMYVCMYGGMCACTFLLCTCICLSVCLSEGREVGTCIHVHSYMRICACMYVCMYMYIRMFACRCACTSTCIHVCMSLRMYAGGICANDVRARMHVYMYVGVRVLAYHTTEEIVDFILCVQCICIYIYIEGER